MKHESNDISIIDRALTVQGELHTQGQLVIKGVVRGTLTGETVVIAREGALHASVRVNHITIGGLFEGDVEARGQLIVLATGTCLGKVVCCDFVVEPGGILNADVRCTTG